MRTFAATAALVLLLGACSGGGDDSATEDPTTAESTAEETATTTLESEDGTISVDVPKDWTEASDVPSTITIAAAGPDPLQQVSVTSFDSADGAKKQADATASALGKDDATCEETELGGQAAQDCASEEDGETIHRLLVPVEGGKGSALLLVQTPAQSPEEAGDLAQPIVDSLTLG